MPEEQTEQSFETSFLLTLSTVTVSNTVKVPKLSILVAKEARERRCGIILMSPTHDKVLLVFGKASQKWSPPKGGIDVGETVLQCATRECLEETGLRVTIHEDAKTMVIRKQYYYCATSPIEAMQLPLRPWDTNEVQKLKWWSWDKLATVDPEQCNMIVMELRRESMKDKIMAIAMPAIVVAEKHVQTAPTDLPDFN